MVAFGWHMHPLYDLRYDFPYHPNVRPLFLSFHLNRLDMLSDEPPRPTSGRTGPIGCRDWTTVFLLLSAGIDAFFTGCLTTTVDAVFPAREAAWTHDRGGRRDRPARRRRPGAAPGTSACTPTSPTTYRTMSLVDGRPGGHRAPDRLPAAPRPRGHRAAARVPPADVAGRAGRVQGREPGRRALRRPDRPAPGRRPPDARCGTRSASWSPARSSRCCRGRRGGRRLRPLARPHRASASRRRGDGSTAPVADPPTTIDVPAAVAASRAGAAGSGRTTPSTRTTVTDVVLAFDQNLTFPAAVLRRVDARERVRPAAPVGARSRAARHLPGLAGGGVPVAPDHLPAVRPDQLRARWPPAPHPEADHDLDDGPAAPAADARRRGPGRLPRRRHGDARRRVPPRPDRPRRRAGRRARLERQRGQRVATRRTPPPGADGHRPATTLRAPIRLRDRRAQRRRPGHGPRPDAARRLHGDDARLGRALRAQRPGQHARLRRAGPRRARSALERAARPRGRRRPERHPLGQPRQAVGARPDVRAGALAAVRGAGAAARGPPADGRGHRRSRAPRRPGRSRTRSRSGP